LKERINLINIKTLSVEETLELGYRLGNQLKKGDIICLNGDLGAGKTAFTSGIAKAMGIQGYITSPTFTIVNEYNAAVPLYHFDVYRIVDSDEMYEIGFDEYIDGNGIIVIEWADSIKNIIPQNQISVRIKKTTENEDARDITIDFAGDENMGREKKFMD
jgi:tRNA threonylcarbamoyladenosine biosynthesis protein TsaE